MSSLTFDVFWRDHGATKGAKDLGDETEKSQKKMDRFKGAATAAGAAAGLVLFKLGKDSIAAFKEAEQAQTRLSDAFTKFPQLADTNVGALRKLNTALAQKTRFDDDATASGQAVLAQFELTGKQITELTPLLQDYAAKTGTDLPTAAEQLGKAVLGQGRALKAVGIDFHDTGTAAGNLEQITAGLRTQVGGFAEKEGKTAAGQSEILKNRFGELQEEVGGKLIPILLGLTKAGLAASAWIEEHSKLVIAATVAVGAFVTIVLAAKVATAAWTAAQIVATAATAAWTAAQWLLNAALTANPIGIVIVAVAALVAGIVVAYKRSETFRTTVQLLWQAMQILWQYAQTAASVIASSFLGIKDAAVTAWNVIRDNVINPMKDGFDKIKDLIDGIGRAWNNVKGFFGKINPFGGTGGVGGLQSAFDTSPGGRTFPLPGGRGAYRVTQGLHPNNAIDYAAPTGTPVFASFSGHLTTADLGNRSYGKYFRLSGSGAPILGAHLSSFARGSGPISKGELIGRTGTTGNSTGPHLHLENFDVGGRLLPGWNMVRNDTGRVENVRPVAAGGGMTVHMHIAGSVTTVRDLARDLKDELNRMGRRGDVLPT